MIRFSRRLFVLLGLLVFVGLVSSCADDPKAGSFEVIFEWEDDPPTDRDVYVYGKVEQRSSLDVMGVQLAESSVLPYTPNVRLDFSDTPYKDHLVVVVEIKDEASKTGTTLYYGISNFFETKPGEHVVVPVTLSLVSTPDAQEPDDETLGESPIIILEATGPTSCANCYVNRSTVTLAVKATRADTVVVANDREFSAESVRTLRFADLEVNDDGYALIPDWDLNEGIPDAATDGPRRVYMKLQDAFGYESDILQKQVELDRTAPTLDDNLLSKSYAKSGDVVRLSLNPSEILLGAPALSVSPRNPGFPEDAVKTGESYVYSWTVLQEGITSGESFTFSVRLADLAGNESTIALTQVVEDGETETRLTLDTETPLLTAHSLSPDHEGTLHINNVSLLSANLSVLEQIGLAEGFPKVAVGLLDLQVESEEQDGSTIDLLFVPRPEDYDTEAKRAALEGTHSVLVTLADLAENRSTHGIGSVKFDFTPPRLVVTVQAPNGNMASLGQSVVLSVSATDGETTAADWLEANSLMVASVPEMDWSAVEGPTASGTGFVWTIPVTTEHDGDYVFTLSASDLAGNAGDPVSSAAVLLDGQAPGLVLDGNLMQQAVEDTLRHIAFSLDFTVNATDVPAERVFAELRDAEGHGEPMVVEARSLAGQYRASLTIDVDHFGQTLSEIFKANVSAQDEAGNWGSTESAPIQIDLRPPELVSVEVTPQRDNGTGQLLLALTADERLLVPPTVMARMNGDATGAFDIVFSPQEQEGGSLRYSYTGSWPVLLPAEGEYTYQLLPMELRDMAANLHADVVPETPVTFILDLQAPAAITEFRLTPESGSAVAAGQSIRLEFNVDDNDFAPNYPKVRIGPYVFVPDTQAVSEYALSFVYAVTGEEVEAEQTVTVELLDEAGNVSETDVGALTFDFTAPMLTAIISPQERMAGSGQEVTLFIRSNEPLDDEGIRVSASATWPGVTTELFERGLLLRNTVADGTPLQTITYTFSATDAVGNETANPLEVTLVLDGVKPAVGSTSFRLVKDGVTLSEPVPVKQGDKISYCFELNKEGVQTLNTTFGGLVLGEIERLPDRLRCWNYTVLADDFQGLSQPEGVKSFLLEMVDEMGNRGWASSEFPMLTLDFTPPQLLELDAFPAAAALGCILGVWVRSSEVLDDAVTVTARNAERSIVLAPVVTEGRNRLFEHVVTQADHSDLPYTLEVSYRDTAGNPGVPNPYLGEERLILDAVAPVRYGETQIYDSASGLWVALSEAYLFQHPFKDQAEVRLRWMVEESNPPLPDVAQTLIRLDGRSLGTITASATCYGESPVCPVNVSAYEWHYTVLANDWLSQSGAPLDGRRSVSLHLTDLAGNQAPAESFGQFAFDFHAPEPSGIAQLARCDEYAPARIAANVLRVKADDYGCSFSYTCEAGSNSDAGPLRIALSLNEPVEMDTVSLGVDGGSAFVLDPCASSNTYLVGTYQDFSHEPGPRDVLLDVRDPAGNRAVHVVGSLVFDFEAPPAPDTATPGLFTYYRIPWGSEATQGQKRYYLSGATGATEAGARIGVYNCMETVETEPLATIDVREDGAFGARPGEEGSWSIPSGNVPKLCVAAWDQAGNRSEKSLVHDVEWVATMGYKRPGDSIANPHEFIATKRFDPILTQEHVWDVGNPSIVALPAGDLQTAAEGVWEESEAQAWSNDHPYWGAAVTYDTNRGEALMYGGCNQLDRDSGYWCQRPMSTLWIWKDGLWTLRNTPTKPEKRVSSAMSYNPVDTQAVLFGGKSDSLFSYTLFDDTWTWKDYHWKRLSPQVSPSARFGHAMTYISGTNEILLFGGCTEFASGTGGTCLAYSDETYIFKNGEWELLETPFSKPPARMGHAMAYHPAYEMLLMYGGETAPGIISNDAWVYFPSARRWVEVDDAPMTGRMGHTMVYDEHNAHILMTGGASGWTDGSGGIGAKEPIGPSDSWTFNFASWTWSPFLAGSGTTPEDLAFSGGFYDRMSKNIVLAGGVSHGMEIWRYDVMNDEWADASLSAYDVNLPTLITTSVYDDARGELVLYCGGCESLPNGTGTIWSWDGYRWIRGIVGAPLPNPIYHFSLAYDPVEQVSFLFGGDNGTNLSNRTWKLEGSGNWYWWQDVGNSATVGERQFTYMVHDSTRSRMLLHGGYRDATYFNDTYIWDGVSWQELITQDPPAGATEGAMVYDSLNDRVIRFGGLLGGAWESHMATLYGSSFWEEIMTGNPPARDSHGMVYDDDRAAAILFGGKYVLSELSDTWELKSRQWRRVQSDGPDARAYFSMAYHKKRKKTLVYGGLDSPDDLWLYDSGADNKTAHIMEVTLDAADDTGTLVPDAVEVRWRGGASGTFDFICMPYTGAELLVWDKGQWIAMKSLTGSPDDPETVVWRTEDPLQLARLFTGDRRILSVALAPLFPTSCGENMAQVRTDYVEVSVHYKQEE